MRMSNVRRGEGPIEQDQTEQAQERRHPQVSVVIPAHNAMAYLPETLASVLNQTYQNFEVLIVDDGSEDDLQGWYAQLSEPVKSKVRLLSQANKGTCRARNAGIAATHNPYVAFLDADDIWLPQKLERQVALLSSSPDVSLVYCWSATIDSVGAHLGRMYAGRLQRNVWAGLLVKNVISTPSAVLVRRSCLEAVGGFDTDLFAYIEDKDLWLRIARSHQIATMPEVLMHKRRHPFSMSNHWAAMEKASYQVIDKALRSPPSALSDRTLQVLRRKSYAEVNRQMAWKPLQTESINIRVSFRYLKKAWRYRPLFVLSKESFKLLFVMVTISLVGPRRYLQGLRRIGKLRQFISQYKRLPIPGRRPDSDPIRCEPQEN